MLRNLLLLVCSVLTTVSLQAQSPPPFIGLGDSLGESVQSLDAAYETQLNGYLNLIAQQMGVSFPLPLIKTGIFSVIESTNGRTRLNPGVAASNLAVSGADSTSILNDKAGTPIVTETDLVLSPRAGSQISIAESLRSPFMICWIGNSDVLGTVTSFSQMNASQITPVSVFSSNYDQITSRLGALGGKVVFATVPDVTQVALLFSPQDLVAFLGSDFGLPSGSYTSAVAMMLIKLGLNDGSILKDPNWVLDPGEIQTIHQAVVAYNQIITAHAAQIHAPFVDVNGLFASMMNTPPVFGGITLTRRYLGGLFSLDGVHPSNIGHALLANAFIQKIDSFYGMSIPPISQAKLNTIFYLDPFVDFDNDLKVRGRFGVGLLETLGPFIGISGDRSAAAPGVNQAMGKLFMREYFTLKGADPDTNWTPNDAINAFREIFSFAK